MEVWVLSRSAFAEDWEIYGVFSSAERAKAEADAQDGKANNWRRRDLRTWEAGYWIADAYPLDGG